MAQMDAVDGVDGVGGEGGKGGDMAQEAVEANPNDAGPVDPQGSGLSGFGIDCTPGYKNRLYRAASELIDRLIGAMNREGSPLEPAERETSAARMNERKPKKARLINALPDTLPAIATAVATGELNGALAGIMLLVNKRDQVDRLFEILPGIPLVMERVKLGNNREMRSVKVAQLVGHQHGHNSDSFAPHTDRTNETNESIVPVTEPIAPFYWRCQVYRGHIRYTDLIWFTTLVDDEGAFLARVSVCVKDDPTTVVRENVTISALKGDVDNAGEGDHEESSSLRLRLVDAPNGEIFSWWEFPDLYKGIWEMRWPPSIQRPADVFGRAGRLGRSSS
jgi:hypothetical protein